MTYQYKQNESNVRRQTRERHFCIGFISYQNSLSLDINEDFHYRCFVAEYYPNLVISTTKVSKHQSKLYVIYV